jgi:thiol-disulfide isomerase/thioredoxin
MKKIIFILLNFLFISGLCQGIKAPDFKLNTIDGKEIKLSDYKGKKVILNFWATWCGPCRAEIPDFVKFYNENKNKVEIIGIAVNSKESEIVEIIKKYKITYPVCISNEEIEKLYGPVNAVPTSFIIDENGYIKGKKIGIMKEDELKEIIK